VRAVFVKPELKDYMARLVGKTRNHPEIALGVSTRGTINLFHASQARAAILGRPYVVPDDVKALVDPVLGHRIILRPNAEMQGASATRILHQLMEREQVPQTAYDA
jgi:MoxR-like ATPase